MKRERERERERERREEKRRESHKGASYLGLSRSLSDRLLVRLTRDCRVETGNYVWGSISGVVLPRELVPRDLAEFAAVRMRPGARQPEKQCDATRRDAMRLNSTFTRRAAAAKSSRLIKVVTTALGSPPA